MTIFGDFFAFFFFFFHLTDNFFRVSSTVNMSSFLDARSIWAVNKVWICWNRNTNVQIFFDSKMKNYYIHDIIIIINLQKDVILTWYQQYKYSMTQILLKVVYGMSFFTSAASPLTSPYMKQWEHLVIVPRSVTSVNKSRLNATHQRWVHTLSLSAGWWRHITPP